MPYGGDNTKQANMAGITQNKQMPYFHCGPLKICNKKKSKEGVSKSFKDSKRACKQDNIN